MIDDLAIALFKVSRLEMDRHLSVKRAAHIGREYSPNWNTLEQPQKNVWRWKAHKLITEYGVTITKVTG